MLKAYGLAAFMDFCTFTVFSPRAIKRFDCLSDKQKMGAAVFS